MQLNVNENPYGPSPLVRRRHRGRGRRGVASSLNRYPDREFAELRAALAAYLAADTPDGVRPEQVWAANGSNEVMLQLLQAFGGPGRMALSFAPTYSMYPEYARDTIDHLGRGPPRRRTSPSTSTGPARWSRSSGPSVVLLPSPNNPTGTALPPEAVTALCEAGGDGCVVVVDEAYGEFRRAGTPSALELLPRHRNLVVTRTMSKAFALAGARVGYLAADPAICDAIRVVRLPYHLSAVTQAVALAALRHAPELLARSTSCAPSATRRSTWLRDQGLRGRRQRRQFRVVRPVPGSSCCLAGAARPGRAHPRGGPGRVAAGLDRHGSGDDDVQAGADRGARTGDTDVTVGARRK